MDSIEYSSKIDSYGLDKIITLGLMKAAEHGLTTDVENLIMKGADVNSINSKTGKTALTLASKNGHTETARLLIKHSANVDGKDKYTAPLSVAIENGHAITAQMLLENGANLHETYALDLASIKGHNDIVKMLIEKCTHFNGEDLANSLMSAIMSGHADVAETLIESGANMEYRNEQGESILETAFSFDRTLIAKILIEKGAKIDDALIFALTYKRTEIINIFKSLELDTKRKDKYGRTLLTLAATNGEIELMANLIDKGSDIEKKDVWGMTPLMCASNLKAVEILIDKGADVNVRSNDGTTALMFAARKGLKDVVEKLIEHGACIHGCNNDGRTALMFATEPYCTDALTFLIEKGADLNKKASNGDTALTLATTYGLIKTVEILINNGADVLMQGRDGCTALFIAMMKRHEVIFKMLVDKKSILDKHLNERAKDNPGTVSPITPSQN